MTDSNVDHVEVYRDTADQYRWRALAANGEIVAEGEAHTREHDAASAAQGVFGPDVLLVREPPTSSASDGNDDWETGEVPGAAGDGEG